MTAPNEQADDLLVGFIDESADSIQDLAGQLEEFRQDPKILDPINSVFRSIHSIKGNAGFFGLLAIKKFSHSLENTLDDIRNANLSLSEDLQRALVEGFDLLDELLQHILEGETADDLGEGETELLIRIEKLSSSCRIEVSDEDLLQEAVCLVEEILKEELPQSADWAERVRNLIPTLDESSREEEEDSFVVLQPAELIQAKFVANDQDISNYVGKILNIFLLTDSGKYEKELGNEFKQAAEEFAVWADSAEQPGLAEKLRTAIENFITIDESPLDMDSTLLSIVWDNLWIELGKYHIADESKKDSTTDAKKKEEAGGDKPDKKQAASKIDRPKTRLLRVKEEQVDGFMDDVSNLFITCERMKDLHSRMANQKQLRSLVDELRQINASFASQANDLQQSVVSLRKVPVRGLFSKFPRLARTLATKLGKQLNVHLVGEDIEIDKSLVEDLDSPLTHMVRNVCDHGIEPPEDRVQRGVPEAGTMWLKCELTRTHVVITIQDDGRGIDSRRIRDKVVEKGVLTQSQANALSEEEAVDLIFHPGLSTAEQISDVSGRGVGLDVVRTTLREYDGDVKVQSQLGIGTTFRLEIPIRQAVLVVDGLLVKQGQGEFVLPFECIQEIVELTKDDLKTVQGSFVASIRGRLFGAAKLGELLELDGPTSEIEGPIQGVLIGTKKGSMCLLVERVLGQRKVVVNSLEKILPGTGNLTGVAQLGGGRLALVLSAPDLIESSKDYLQNAELDTGSACQELTTLV